MKFLFFMLFSVVVILIKENFCVPAIRPLSQRGIIFPVENWDNCYLDAESKRPGLCKKLEECPIVLKKWDEENVYPKTCYFIKKQQFVCCPPPASEDVLESIASVFNTNTKIVTEKPLDSSLLGIFNTEGGGSTTTYRPSNIFLDKVDNKTTSTTRPLNSFLDITTTTSTKRPSNIFLESHLKDKTTTTTTTSTKRPSNIFLENSNAQKNTSVRPFLDNFVLNEQSSSTKRRSEAECDIENPQNIGSIDINGAVYEPSKFPFMVPFEKLLFTELERQHSLAYLPATFKL